MSPRSRKLHHLLKNIGCINPTTRELCSRVRKSTDSAEALGENVQPEFSFHE